MTFSLDEYLAELAPLINLDCGSLHQPGITAVADLMAALSGVTPTGLADAGVAFTHSDEPPTIPPVTEITPEEEDGFDALLAAAEAMLAEEGAPLSPREFAHLARQLWREVEDLGADMPLPARIATIIERRRTMLRAARRLAVGPWRPRT